MVSVCLVEFDFDFDYHLIFFIIFWISNPFDFGFDLHDAISLLGRSVEFDYGFGFDLHDVISLLGRSVDFDLDLKGFFFFEEYDVSLFDFDG